MLAVAILVAAIPTLPNEFAAWRICYVNRGDLWTCDGTGEHQKRIVPNGSQPCWSPDHKRVAFARGSSVWVARADGAGLVRIFHSTAKGAKIEGITWAKGVRPVRAFTEKEWQDGTPDQSILFAISNKVLHVQVRHGKFGKAREFYPIHLTFDGWIQAPALSHDGRRVAVSVEGDVWMAWSTRFEGRGGISGWEFSRIAAVARHDLPTYRADSTNVYARELSWSRDGLTLAYALRRIGEMPGLGLLRIDPKAGPGDMQDRCTRRGLAEYAQNPSFSPNSKWILASVYVDGESLVAFSVDGRHRYTILDEGSLGQACW